VDAGRLNFKEALTQSCNTWFYQAGLKIGPDPIIQYATQLGLGRRTGIPLRSEAAGNIPNDDYMQRVHKRTIKGGDVANMSIGQGDILISPLQMTQAMAVVANGGVVHQARLVLQVQTIDNKVIAAYPDRIREEITVSPIVRDEMRRALVAVTSDGQGTAHSAKVKGIDVAGKTGTAQWGPTDRQRIAAWFTGFMPAAEPRYAFTALYEGEPNDQSVHGGSHAAPLIGKAFREIYHPKKAASKEAATSPVATTPIPEDESNPAPEPVPVDQSN